MKKNQVLSFNEFFQNKATQPSVTHNIGNKVEFIRFDENSNTPFEVYVSKNFFNKPNQKFFFFTNSIEFSEQKYLFCIELLYYDNWLNQKKQLNIIKLNGCNESWNDFEFVKNELESWLFDRDPEDPDCSNLTNLNIFFIIENNEYN